MPTGHDPYSFQDGIRLTKRERKRRVLAELKRTDPFAYYQRKAQQGEKG